MTQTYIEYLYPGIIFSESSTEKVGSRDIPKKIPDSCFGFRFFDMTETESGGEILRGQPKNYSNWYYVNGEVLDLKQVKEHHSDKRILISNMENNDVEKVIKTKFGQFIPLQKEDVVLEEMLYINHK